MRWQILTRHKWWVTAIAAAMAAVTYVIREIPRAEALRITSDGSGYPGFFTAQISSILSGSFEVPVTVLGDECYLIDGACIGYFGITPSVLRVPLLLTGIDGDFTGLMMGIAYTLVVGASVFLVLSILDSVKSQEAHQAVGARALVVLSALLVCGPGSIALLATRADVANEAILWCALWTTLAAIVVFRCVDARHAVLVWAVPCVVLASLSRPVGATYGIALGLGALIACIRTRPVRRGPVLTSLAIALAGPISLALSFILKFGSLLPPADAYVFAQKSSLWMSILDINANATMRLEFVPSRIWAYLRPDALDVKVDFPRGAFFTPVYDVWPLDPGTTLVEPAPSLTVLAPAALVLLIIGLLLPWMGTTFALSHLRSQAVVLLLMPVGLLPVLIGIAFSARYLVDAAPLLAAGSGVGAAALLAQARWGAPLRVGAGALLVLAMTGYGLLLVTMR